jgi:hypothetical protein
VSQTLVRIMVVLGAALGGITGAIVALTKLVPERAKIIVGYQGEVIDDLREELTRKDEAHKEEISALRDRITLLENEVSELREHKI